MSPIVISPLTLLGRAAARQVARWLPFDRSGLRVLMWHSVGEGHADRGTVEVRRLERQLQWLRDNRYNVLPFSDVLRRHTAGDPLPPRAVVITFDDAFASFPRLAVPALARAGFSATVMVPVAWVRGRNEASPGLDGHMTIGELEGLPREIDIGLHSYRHQDYRQMNARQIADDVRACARLRQQLRRPVLPIFAYPFGGVPRDARVVGSMCHTFATHGVEFGLRIGYGINPWPLQDPWRVRRIAVHGTDSMLRFACKVTLGRVRL
jgi:peptidoglycan/xylan/chitin deacetylase (PgdA/CDA1 family)